MSKPIYVTNKLKIPASKEKTSRRVQKKKLKLKAEKNHRSYRKKWMIIPLTLTAIFLVGLGVFFYVFMIPAQRVLNSARTINANFTALAGDFQSKNLSGIDGYFNSIQTELKNINSEIDRYQFLDELEFTQGYYKNLQVVRSLSEKSGNFLEKSLPDLKVVLESMGYQVDVASEAVASTDAKDAMAADSKTDTAKAEENSLSDVVKELPRLVKLYEELEPDILEIMAEFNELDPAYVPSVGGNDYAAVLTSVQKLTEDYPSLSSQLKETMSALPDLLGAGGSSKYLVILQNEKEMRSSGGILSAFGVVTVENGELKDNIKITDTWDLFFDASAAGAYYQDPVRNYINIYGQQVLMIRGCGAVSLRPQDAGIYPDLHKTMEMFSAYYDAARRVFPDKYPEYDHVVIFNTFFASDLVSFIEPLIIKDDEGNEIKLTSDNLAKEIFSETSSAVFDPSTRKSFIGEVATVAQQKVNDLDAKKFPEIFKKMIHTIQARNVALSSKDTEMQAYFDELGLSGRVEKNFDGDYFQLSEAQVCGLKSNFFIRNTVEQNVIIGDDGVVSKDVQVHWTNSTVFDINKHRHILTDLPRYNYRAWVRFLTPQDTKYKFSDGYEKSRYIYQPQTYFSDVMEKQVIDNVIWYDYRRNTEADPPTEHFLNVSYQLPDTINYKTDNGYRMLLQKHPGKQNEQHTINIQHRGQVTSVTVKLDRDKVLTYRDGVISVEDYTHRLDEYADMLDTITTLNQ